MLPFRSKISCHAFKFRRREKDAEEPADPESEDYDEWGDRHEALEDLADDLRDRLDAMDDL